MNRRHLALIILINALFSFVIALVVVWVYEIRKPEADELALLYAARPDAVLAATPVPANPVSFADSTPREDFVEEEPTETTAPTEATEPSQEVYVVKGGDSLVAIAVRYNVSVEDIVRVNELANPDYVFSGQRLIIPTNQGANTGPTPTVQNVVGVGISGVAGAGDLTVESVQIVNDGDQAFSLQGWQLSRADGPAYTIGNVPLFPGGSVRINTRAGQDSSIELYWGLDTAQWQSGTTAQLLNERGSVIDSFTVP